MCNANLDPQGALKYTKCSSLSPRQQKKARNCSKRTLKERHKLDSKIMTIQNYASICFLQHVKNKLHVVETLVIQIQPGNKHGKAFCLFQAPKQLSRWCPEIHKQIKTNLPQGAKVKEPCTQALCLMAKLIVTSIDINLNIGSCLVFD